jgi:hypothetical protein
MEGCPSGLAMGGVVLANRRGGSSILIMRFQIEYLNSIIADIKVFN